MYKLNAEEDKNYEGRARVRIATGVEDIIAQKDDAFMTSKDKNLNWAEKVGQL